MADKNGKTAPRKRRASSSRSDDSIAISELQGGSRIEKIRDLIFGAEMEAYAREFDRLEEIVRGGNEQIRTEMNERVKSLEAVLVKEVAGLQEKMSEEKEARNHGQAALRADFEEAVQDVHKKLKDARSETADGAQALSDQIREEAARLQKSLDEKTAELSRAVDAALSELRMSKVDRQSLAETLTNLASRLANDDDNLEDG
ncbi:MAG: hypothetical protein KJO98_00700 [Rhodothermia bacterium]|nr:hypothetical protein [Rhodothermia bacterium]